MKKVLTLSFAILIFSFGGRADEAPVKPTPKPKSAKSIETILNIRIDKDAKDARLIIPRSQLKQLRSQIEELDDDSETTASTGISKTQTVASGLLLSLGFVFGGIWFARFRATNPKVGKMLVIGSVLTFGGALVTISLANAGPPADARMITGKMFSQPVHIYKFGFGKIKLELSETARNPELIVPDVPDQKKPDDEE